MRAGLRVEKDRKCYLVPMSIDGHREYIYGLAEFFQFFRLKSKA